MIKHQKVTSLRGGDCVQESNRASRLKFLPVAACSLLLAAVLGVGISVAYLTSQTESVVNTFSPAKASIEVVEEFDGEVKSQVNVVNTGDVECYVRVNLVSYRINDDGRQIGGVAEIPAFTPGTNWVYYNGLYYYTLPVAPGASPATDLIDSIQLQGNYNDADGGKQVIEVMAEGIQSQPAQACGEAWGVTISAGSVTAYAG